MGVYKKDDNWYIDYYHNGQRKRRKIGPSKQLAELALKDVQLKIARGEILGVSETKKILFEDYAKEYLEYSKTNKSGRSYERDIISVNVHLVPYFKGKHLFDITSRMIESYKEKRVIRVKEGTVNMELFAIKKMLRKAVDWGYLRSNPASGVRGLKESPLPPKYLSREETRRLLDNCSGYIHAMVATALQTGMRKSEIFNLQWSDVDFRNRIITVNNKEDWHPKNYEPRAIPMSNFLYGILSGLPHHISSNYVFCKPDGNRFHRIWWSFEKALRKAGLPHIRFHDLRHTFASHLVMAGVDLATVQKLLGHRDIKTTMRYAHLAPDHLRSSIEKIDPDGHYMDTRAESGEKGPSAHFG